VPATVTTTIVIPTYNREQYLSTAIESVLSQTMKDFELIIWDDGSTDDSLEIAHYYAQQDSRVQTVSAPHQGQTKSLKDAFATAKGKYLGWVDSDDILALSALEETTKILDIHPEVGLVYTDYQVIDDNNQVRRYGYRCQMSYSKEKLLTDFMTFHFRLMRQSVYEQVGGLDESFERAQDYDLCLRLSEITNFYQLKHPLYYYRSHANSVSNLQQVEQIHCSQRAIANALERRCMTDEYKLEVQIVGHYFLKRKKKA
jgi:glycosyltransferase involved in cell wall biosynthesis